MSDEQDALEQELESMRPCGLSPDVRRRIGRSLLRERQLNHNARWWWGGLVAVAACLAIAGFAWHLRSARDRGPRNSGPEPRDLAIAAMPDPTLGSYKLAFAQSTDRFDALLDKEAARPLATTGADSRTFRPFDLNSIP